MDNFTEKELLEMISKIGLEKTADVIEKTAFAAGNKPDDRALVIVALKKISAK